MIVQKLCIGGCVAGVLLILFGNDTKHDTLSSAGILLVLASSVIGLIDSIRGFQ